MKKFLAFCCVAVFVMSLAACTGPGEVTQTDPEKRNVPGNGDVTQVNAPDNGVDMKPE